MNNIIRIIKQLDETNCVLIEMQGELSHTHEKDFADLSLGILKDVGEDNYEFEIGNHVLKGKKIVLKNPIVALRKIKNEDKNEFFMERIIKEKIIFSNRPTPMLNTMKKLN